MTLALGLGLGLLCAAERAFPIRFGLGKAPFEFGDASILFALVLGGPLCALVAALPSAAYRDPSRAAFQGAVHVVQVLAGSLVFLLLSPNPPLALLTTAPIEGFVSWGSLGLGTVAAGLVFFGLNALIGPTLMRLKYGLSWREVFMGIVLLALPSDALAVATVLAAVPLATFSGTTAALILLGGTSLSLLAVTRLREHRKKTLRLETQNAALRDALRTSNMETGLKAVESMRPSTHRLAGARTRTRQAVYRRSCQIPPLSGRNQGPIRVRRTGPGSLASAHIVLWGVVVVPTSYPLVRPGKFPLPTEFARTGADR